MPNPGIGDDKLAKIQGMILSGEKPAIIMAELGVSAATISRAKAKISTDLLQKMDDEQNRVIVDLVMHQLESGLEASIAISNQAHNENWRNGQNAAQLATLYGVITDKNIRLLEASAAANEVREQNDRTIEETGSFS